MLGCAEGNGNFYVIIAGPPRADTGPRSDVVAVVASTGDELRWRSQNGSGNSIDRVLLARFDQLPEAAEYLDVTFSQHGSHVFTTRVHPYI